jgi:DNA-binding MarR family transcriptional regulator
MLEPDVTRVKFCACGSLRRATRELTLYYDQILKPSGIHITQFTFLVNLAREGALNVSKLATLLVMDQTTVTRNLSQLEEAGLIERVAGSDRRSRIVTLSVKGQQALVAAIPLWEQAQVGIIEGMGQERFQTTLKEVANMVKQTRHNVELSQ